MADDIYGDNVQEDKVSGDKVQGNMARRDYFDITISPEQTVENMLSVAGKVISKNRDKFPATVQGIPIPIVIVAMTNEEANELLDGTVFSKPFIFHGEEITLRPEVIENFNKIKNEVSVRNQTNIKNNYGPHPQNWTPYKGVNILNIVTQVVEELGQVPIDLTERFFDEDDNRCKRTWYELNQSGCILVIDALSIFHPKIHYLLPTSQLLRSDDAIAILMISPIDFSRDEVNHLIKQGMHSWGPTVESLNDFGMQFHLSIEGERMFIRWLISILPETTFAINERENGPKSFGRHLMKKKIVREHQGGMVNHIMHN